MATLKQIILNEIDNRPRGYADELAKISKGFSSGSALKKALKKDSPEFDDFFPLVNIVEYIFPDRDEQKRLMGEYALTLDPNKQTSRYMLEYCEINGLRKIKEQLLEAMINCKNTTSQEWAEVYRIEHSHARDEINLNKAVHLYSNLNPKHPETIVGSEIYKSYCYLKDKQYDMVYHSLMNVEFYIEQISEPYIKDLYNGRYLLLLVSHYIRNTNVDYARELCNKIIDEVSYPEMQTWANLHLGNSYIITDFDKSYSYLVKGYELSVGKHNNANKNIKRSINFLHNVWNKKSPYLNLESKDASDVHEIAFYYVNNKQYTEAEKALNTVNVEALNSNQLGFNLYIRGLMTKDMNILAKSVRSFQKSGDYFFMQLPLIQLKNMGIPECIIKVMAHED